MCIAGLDGAQALSEGVVQASSLRAGGVGKRVFPVGLEDSADL